jgi:hypothetical protein
VNFAKVKKSAVRKADIRAMLEQSLSEKSPRPLYQLAVILGYVNEGYIQQKFPELCSAAAVRVDERIGLFSIFDNLRWSATGESTFDELSPLKPGHVVPSSFSAGLKPLSLLWLRTRERERAMNRM